MKALLSAVIDLVGNLLPDRGLYTSLCMILILLAVTLAGITGRVAVWLDTRLFRR